MHHHLSAIEAIGLMIAYGLMGVAIGLAIVGWKR